MWYKLAIEEQEQASALPLSLEQLNKLRWVAQDLPDEAQEKIDKYLQLLRKYIGLYETGNLSDANASLVLDEIKEQFELFREEMAKYSRPSLGFLESEDVEIQPFELWMEEKGSTAIAEEYAIKHIGDILKYIGLTRRKFPGLTDEEIFHHLGETHGDQVYDWLEQEYYQRDLPIEQRKEEIYKPVVHSKEHFHKWLKRDFDVEDQKELVARLTSTFYELLRNPQYSEYRSVNGKMFKDIEGKPHAIIVMGEPGSGKSFYLEKIKNYVSPGGLIDPQEATHALIDPDYFAEFVPGFASGRGSNNVLPWTKSIQLNILKKLQDQQEDLPNVVIPLVGSVESQVLNEINRFKSLGYDVDVAYVSTKDPNLNAFLRALKPSARITPPTDLSFAPMRVFLKLADEIPDVRFIGVEGGQITLPNGKRVVSTLPEEVRNNPNVIVERMN